MAFVKLLENVLENFLKINCRVLPHPPASKFLKLKNLVICTFGVPTALRSATIPTMLMASVPEHQLLPPPPPMQQGDLPMARREIDTGFLTDISALDTQPGIIPYAEPIEYVYIVPT